MFFTPFLTEAHLRIYNGARRKHKNIFGAARNCQLRGVSLVLTGPSWIQTLYLRPLPLADAPGKSNVMFATWHICGPPDLAIISFVIAFFSRPLSICETAAHSFENSFVGALCRNFLKASALPEPYASICVENGNQTTDPGQSTNFNQVSETFLSHLSAAW